jgi:hypothetical protein
LVQFAASATKVLISRLKQRLNDDKFTSDLEGRFIRKVDPGVASSAPVGLH